MEVVGKLVGDKIHILGLIHAGKNVENLPKAAIITAKAYEVQCDTVYSGGGTRSAMRGAMCLESSSYPGASPCSSNGSLFEFIS